MKKYLFLSLAALTICVTLTSCCRNRCEVWEDTKTCGRYMGKGLRSLLGQHVDSREYASYYNNWGDDELSQGGDFIPLAADESDTQLLVREYPASRESPGDPGSKVPSLNDFSSPTGQLATLFRKIQFDTDSYSVQGGDNVVVLREIAAYLAKHPAMYIFIEGHADERGAAAYNLALGVRRANAVRSLLIENGIDPDRLFTISYGLERPVAFGHDELSWKQNRRAEFKVYGR